MSTALKGWHPGELAIQRKLNFATAMTEAWTGIDGAMPEQHSRFYCTRLPFIPITTLDARGRPWGSLLAGARGLPGFVRSPSSTVLEIDACVWDGDPWTENVEASMSGAAGVGAKFLVAGIGVDFSTRRRNKFAGCARTLRRLSEHDWAIMLEVNQAIG